MYALLSVAVVWPCEEASQPLDGLPADGATGVPATVKPLVWIGDGSDHTLGDFHFQLVGPEGPVGFGTEELLWEESPYDVHWTVLLHPTEALATGEHSLTARRSDASEQLELRFTVDDTAAKVPSPATLEVIAREAVPDPGDCGFDEATRYTLLVTPGEGGPHDALHLFRTDGTTSAYTLGQPPPTEPTELVLEREAGLGDCFYVVAASEGLEQAEPSELACWTPPDTGPDDTGRADTSAPPDTADGDPDSAPPDDADPSQDTAETEAVAAPDPEEGGCGCGGSGPVVGWFVALLAAWRRGRPVPAGILAR